MSDEKSLAAARDDYEALYEKLWDTIATVRDMYPRDSNDAPTDEIVDAVMAIISQEKGL
jgi:hypothetical protein